MTVPTEPGRAPAARPHECAHGYARAADCPRCGVAWSSPPRRVVSATRWHATATTLGPRLKIALTAAFVVPIAICLYGLSLAGRHPGNAFFALPLGVLVVLGVALFPVVWERAKRTQ